MSKTNGKASQKGLSASALAKVCGVSSRTVRNWLTADTPVPRYKRASRFYFEPQAVASWLAAQEKHAPLARLNGYIASLEPTEPAPAKSEADTKAEAYARRLKRQTNAAAREARKETQASEADKATRTPWNIFKVRDTSARLYAEAMRMYVLAPVAEKVAHQKNVNAAADTLRKLELDCLTVAKEMNLVMLVSDAARIIGNATARIKHDLLTLPESLAADLAALDSEQAVANLLKDRITDLLRHLTDALRKLDTPQPKPDKHSP